MTSHYGNAAAVRSKLRRLLAVALLLPAFLPAGASARVVEVKVDARSAPWDRRSNPRLSFGLGDGQRPKMVFGAPLFAGIKVNFRASGSAEWIGGGTRFGPGGDPSLIVTRSLELLPSHYTSPIGMGGLVGAFVSADGVVVGKPFAIGEGAEVEVPAGAFAIALGVNDDRFSDNSGGFVVTINIPDPSVTVEAEPEAKP